MEQAPVATAQDRDSRSYILRLQGDRLIEVSNASTLPPFRSDDCVRGLVEGFSVRSAQRMRDYLLAARVEYRTMATLTYPSWSPRGTDPDAFKRDLRVFMQRLSRYLTSQRKLEGKNLTGWSIFWWLEFTGAGVAHFHLFLTDFVGKRWLSVSWADIIAQCDQRVVSTATRVEQLRGGRAEAARYAWSYASKSEQKKLPLGVGSPGRWWGVCGRRDTTEAAIRARPGALPLLGGGPAVIKLWRNVSELEERGFARKLGGLPGGMTVWQIPDWHDRDELYHLLRRCGGEFVLAACGHFEEDWWISAEGYIRWINPPQVESSDGP